MFNQPLPSQGGPSFLLLLLGWWWGYCMQLLARPQAALLAPLSLAARDSAGVCATVSLCHRVATQREGERELTAEERVKIDDEERTRRRLAEEEAHFATLEPPPPP